MGLKAHRQKAEAREMAAAGLKGSTFFFSDGASTNYCHVTCVIKLQQVLFTMLNVITISKRIPFLGPYF